MMRDVLGNTERMTNVIGSGNQVGPWAQETEKAQDAIATRMCQLAIGYRDSPLSATYLQEGLHAGDRVPDLPVRYHAEGGVAGRKRHCSACSIRPGSRCWRCVPQSRQRPRRLHGAVQPWCHLIGAVELAPASEAARERCQGVFGRSDGVFLGAPGWLCRFRQR